MKRIALLLTLLTLLLTLLSALSVLPASADSFYTVSVTDGESSVLTNPSVRKYWNPATADSKVTVTLKEGAVTDGIYISWYDPNSVFTLTAFDAQGKAVTVYKNGDRHDGYSCFYPLDEAARRVEIAMPANGNDYGIVYLELSEKGKDNPDMMKWKEPASSCDLLVVSTHQDDEYIFLGAVIPKYLDAGYSVCLAYTATCARLRVEEGLKGIWTAGIRNYPDFMGYEDKGRKETFDEAAKAWGGLDAVVKSYVRELRMRKPTVVVTHDENGENYHNSHKVTAAALKQAVEYAADPTYDPESAEQYGTWQVSKLYLHLYKKNQIHLNYSTPLQSYGGKTAYEVATDAYDCHKSQHEWYMLNWSAIQPGAKYDNRLFGCYFSTVGYDDIDLFYNTPIYRGGTNPPELQTDPPTTTKPPASSSTDPAKTDPPKTTSETVKTDPPKKTTTSPAADPPATTSKHTAQSDPQTTPVVPDTSNTPITSPVPAPDTGGSNTPDTGTSGPIDLPVTSGTSGSTTAQTTASGPSPLYGNETDRPILQALLGFGIAAAAAVTGVIIGLVLRWRRRRL